MTVKPSEDVEIFAAKNDKIELRAEIPVFIFAPVKMGETAGKICVIINEVIMAEYPLVYMEDVHLAYSCLNSTGPEVLI